MRLTRLWPVLGALATASAAAAQDAAPQTAFLDQTQLAQAGGESFAYQMRVVVSHLYHDRDVFVRELLSNANDALEKVRLLSLTDPKILEPAPQLNVSVLADTEGGRIVIRDSGVGMTKDQLASNLGTIARSGTSEFLSSLEKGDGSNLIGQFGLGFYSSFLVADRVTVASKANDSPEQWVFESEADAEGFRIVEDPRGVTLGRGTEITLYLKDDAKAEYLDQPKLRSLIQKHAEYNAAPIYLYNKPAEKVEEVDEDVAEVKVEDAAEDEQGQVESQPEWELVNDRPPLWMREPKEVTDEEYERGWEFQSFYMKTFNSPEPPLAWTHFKGDAGSTAFRALVYLPSGMLAPLAVPYSFFKQALIRVPNDFYSKDYVSLDSLKLFVRRVFITSDLGKDYLEKHLNWIKAPLQVFVDVDDLPLNVGRDSLQKTKALAQIKRNLTKRIYDLFSSLASKEPTKFLDLYEKAGTTLKIGAVEDTKNRERIIKLLRFETSAGENKTSLDEVVARRKVGQGQIYFIAGAGQTKAALEKSPFVERILARGYEVLYLTEPIDEMLVSAVPTYGGMRFQDVSKEGVKFGDEGELRRSVSERLRSTPADLKCARADDDEDAKEEEASFKSTFQPLVSYLKKELAQFVDKVSISSRLVASPCLVTASTYGYSGNMERLLAAQNAGGGDNFMLNFAKMQKKLTLPRLSVNQNFEINPKHPLIERLLEKVEEAETDEGAADELRETVNVLWRVSPLPPASDVSQTALLKSSYAVPDPNAYFAQIESMLRRSLGVSQSAAAEIDIKPAPPVETGPVRTEAPPPPPPSFGGGEEGEGEGAEQPDVESWGEWSDIKKKLKDGAGTVVDTIKKGVPDLSDEDGAEYLHEEL
ncbi:SPOSA6832_00070 [Sporobolomyces salmonicolor]|uniref:SPOSA6832_00070-mRNA-1:cds n=1 Tax=Sporidiobolus salmonicolor TaxID=5005 RepID=A0A0D6EF73_SPOSA|nr:SPOSA6832_00070 [Sporobolomyces salmonicolor]